MLCQALERSRWPTGDRGVVSLQPLPHNDSGRGSNFYDAVLWAMQSDRDRHGEHWCNRCDDATMRLWWRALIAVVKRWTASV